MEFIIVNNPNNNHGILFYVKEFKDFCHEEKHTKGTPETDQGLNEGNPNTERNTHRLPAH